MEESVVLTPSLDALIREREINGNHIPQNGICDYHLGRGQLLSKKKCKICELLSALIDLSVSWSQIIDTGRLTGRTIEIVESFGARSEKDAESIWNLYRECDTSQRLSQKSLLRRYYLSFSCNKQYYTLRDVTLLPESPPPLPTMIEQLIELFETPNSLPGDFIHGNPTVSSISFLGKLPVPLKHGSYSSKYLIQVDFGGADSYAVTHAAKVLFTKRKTSSIILGDEPLGAIVPSKDQKTLLIRAEASFSSFLKEYPQHWKPIAIFLLFRGLLSLYPTEETTPYLSLITPSSKKSLKDAYEEVRGKAIPLDLVESLRKIPSHSPV